MICPNCQKEIPDAARACGYCGHWLAGEQTTPAQETDPTISTGSPRRSSPGLWLGLGVVAVAVIGVIAYLFSSGGGQANTEATIAAAVAATRQAETIQPMDAPTFQPTDLPQPLTDTPIPEPTHTPKPTHTSAPPTATPTPEPTNTPQPPTATPMPTATIDADPTVYDNFNNPAFDGTINPGRWEKEMPWGSGCSIQQKEGKVVYFSSGPANNPLCILASPLVSLLDVGAMEAIIYAEAGGVGSYNIGVVEFVSPLTSDKVWFAQCGIFQDPNENNWITAALNVDTSNSEEGQNSFYDGGSLAFGQWYKFRLEIHPASLEVKCYLNDILFASHIPEQAETIQANGISKQLVGYWSENTRSTYYFDDVRFFPNAP